MYNKNSVQKRPEEVTEAKFQNETYCPKSFYQLGKVLRHGGHEYRNFLDNFKLKLKLKLIKYFENSKGALKNS